MYVSHWVRVGLTHENTGQPTPVSRTLEKQVWGRGMVNTGMDSRMGTGAVNRGIWSQRCQDLTLNLRE